jgi:hypothetical protein
MCSFGEEVESRWIERTCGTRLEAILKTHQKNPLLIARNGVFSIHSMAIAGFGLMF